MSILLKLFQKAEKREMLPNIFYEANSTLITKTRLKKKLQNNFLKEYRPNNPKENTSKLNPTVFKRSYTMTNWDLYQEHTNNSTSEIISQCNSSHQQKQR